MTVIVLVGILPLSNFVGHSHWEYIKWMPTAEDLRSPKYLLDIGSDLIGNALLFMPLGFFLSRLLGSWPISRQLVAGFGLAGVLSVGIEWYQVYCHNRFPSVFDLITNIGGAMAGVKSSVRRPGFMMKIGSTTLIPSRQDRSPAP
ncbi:MAG TPA: VanZ family protein [Nitrospira sp.]|nr:VanZ family protein [Nitrospira sp.]